MRIKVFVNLYYTSEKVYKIDTCAFVQKTYLTTNYIESIIEKDFDMKNKFECKNLKLSNKHQRKSFKKLC